MKVNTFVERLVVDAENFGTNMVNLDEYGVERTRGEWMEWFLRWAEWKTEMHREYWGIEHWKSMENLDRKVEE